MKLVIVESPAKAKTIEKFLGSDYRVAASYGHIRDLPSSAREIPSAIRGKPWARLAVDTEAGFEPVYIVPPESRKRVQELKKLVSKADELLLATDEDREGESISWHLIEVLNPEVPVRRITFHEITRGAIERALEEPRDVDERLVRAQEARRVLDRLFGYELSPVLWKKVRTKLSAGRVQSVALRLIVEREEERQRFETNEYWDVTAILRGEDGEPFEATLVQVGDRRIATSRDFDSTTGVLDPGSEALVLTKERAEEISGSLPEVLPWRVALVERKETKQRPAPPFTTSTLQQAASSRLRMSPKRTMMLAQRLYEGIDLGGGDREGLITYMRTDSVTLSEKALSDAAGYIRARFGEEYHHGSRRYTTKARAAQEAHEAIRPSEIARAPDEVAHHLEPDELALYRLIWERTVASQMADARIDRTTVEFEASVAGVGHRMRATGSVLRFPGFLQVYGGERVDALLPPMKEGDEILGEAVQAGDAAIRLLDTEPRKHETRPPPRYTEASLIKRLEEEGIGRPSTYTPTLSTLQERDYVVKKGSYLLPTYVGMAVTHLLREHFPRYVDLAFTAHMEEVLDEIAAGEEDPVEFLRRFYHGNGEGEEKDRTSPDEAGTGLVRQIEEELPRIEYPRIPIGRDPRTGEPIHVRIGRSSVYLQRGDGEDDGSRVTVPVDLLIDDLTPERASELLEVRAKADEPLGRDPESGEAVYVRVGPYGPYVQLGEGKDDKKPKRASLPRGTEPDEVSLDFALRLLSLPRTVGVDPETGEEVTAGLGRYGPYVERAGVYRNLRRFDQIFEVGLDEAVNLLNQKKGKGKTVLKELGAHPESGEEVQLLSGRYGPYVSDGKLNASLPKKMDSEAVDLETAVRLLAEKAAKGGRRRGRGKKGQGGEGGTAKKGSGASGGKGGGKGRRKSGSGGRTKER